MNEILRDLRVLGIDLWYYISRPFKRLIKGYDERDLWGLDVYIARRILPALKEFRKQKNMGYPSGDTGFKDMKSWLKAIDEMIFALEFIQKDDVLNYDKKKEDRVSKGLELLGKYMRNLWD